MRKRGEGRTGEKRKDWGKERGGEDCGKEERLGGSKTVRGRRRGLEKGEEGRKKERRGRERQGGLRKGGECWGKEGVVGEGGEDRGKEGKIRLRRGEENRGKAKDWGKEVWRGGNANSSVSGQRNIRVVYRCFLLYF